MFQQHQISTEMVLVAYRHVILHQVRCTDANRCSNDGVTVTITDSGARGGADFILSQHAFARMGQIADAGAPLFVARCGRRRVPEVFAAGLSHRDG
ncbi:hypothetical protein OPV22_010125 [Ensete ventricosum]|uniref:Uncharacterized protein n=1 Tax=Ensete ventricosum TaxID=4639 RepID=A0AAV8RKG5_ENSVE|nr:hypothetical protein OPV22_010125 [Ensete ventricosum]